MFLSGVSISCFAVVYRLCPSLHVHSLQRARSFAWGAWSNPGLEAIPGAVACHACPLSLGALTEAATDTRIEAFRETWDDRTAEKGWDRPKPCADSTLKGFSASQASQVSPPKMR